LGDRLLNETTYPAVAGLSRDYVVAQFETFRKGERAGTTNARIMRGVARTLDPESSAALGACLATLAIE
jgi:cytochrome c553